jgi:hypothetical protein
VSSPAAPHPLDPVLSGDVAEAVAALKQEDGGDLLVDGGKRIFREDGVLRPLRLLDTKVTTTGAIIATYAAAES